LGNFPIWGFLRLNQRLQNIMPATNQLPKMFYVWVFSGPAVDWTPIGAFSNKYEADKLLEAHRGPDSDSGAIIEEAFDSFMERMRSLCLGPLYRPIMTLAGLPIPK
jgi:hypothetical protein